MNTRRKFLLQSSMATTAFFAANPFKTFSNTIAPVAGVSVHNNKVIFLHTSGHKAVNPYQKLKHVAGLAKGSAAVALLHAGDKLQDIPAGLEFDATMEQASDISFVAKNYKTFYKGDIKIAVITARDGEANVIKRTNDLAAYLKNEKKCHIVVCLSQLGYKNKNSVDDINLAQHSSCLDIIIGGHPSNYFAHTVVAANANKSEVIIQVAPGNSFGFGNIEVGFDKTGNKNALAINNLVAPSKFNKYLC